jgi:hypothetical protein
LAHNLLSSSKINEISQNFQDFLKNLKSLFLRNFATNRVFLRGGFSGDKLNTRRNILIPSIWNFSCHAAAGSAQGRLRASDTKPTKIGCRKYFAKNLYSNGVAFHQKLSLQNTKNYQKITK